MRKCLVPACRNRHGKKEDLSGITFHRLPANQKRRSIWLRAIGLDESFKLPKHCVVCSVHFSEESFDYTSATGFTRLRENVDPSLAIESNINNKNEPVEDYDVSSSESIENVIIEVVSDEESDNSSNAENAANSIRIPECPKTQSDKSTQTSESFYKDLVSRRRLLAKLDSVTKRYKALQYNQIYFKRMRTTKRRKIANLSRTIAGLKQNKLGSADHLSILAHYSNDLYLQQQKRIREKYFLSCAGLP